MCGGLQDQGGGHVHALDVRWRGGAGRRGGKAAGDAAEAIALAHLKAHGLLLVERNYRLARGPHARGGEIHVVLRDADGTLVFVEVRARRSTAHGGAAASVGAAKQRALAYAARHCLMRHAGPPPCRFHVVAIDGDRVEWLQGAFAARAWAVAPVPSSPSRRAAGRPVPS